MPPAVVVPEPKTKKSLVWIGALLIALFVVGVGVARLVGSESEEVSMPAATGTSTGEVTKTTKTKALPSDTLLTAVLATGAALIVLGFLYARMSSIKLPGGAEITLTEAEKEKTAEKVKEKVEGGKIPPEAAPQVTVAALEELAQKKHWVMANPVATTPHVTDAAVDQAVTSAIETAGL